MTGPRSSASGLALLNVSAWIRRQAWLKSIYRHLPVSWRVGVSLALARRAGERLRFRKTARWTLPVASVPRPAPVPRVDFGPLAGVNIFAYARGEFGLAESARLYARALLDAGYPVTVYDIELDMAHSMGDRSLDAHISAVTPYGINLIFVNPDYLDAAIEKIGRERLKGRYNIACWFWELEVFPAEWASAFSEVDEILVSSRFVHDVVRAATNKPILHVPLPVVESPDSGLKRADFGLRDDAFVFLNSFDFNSFQARKNPLATIKAFEAAFGDTDAKVQLLIKSSNGHRHPERLHQLLTEAAGDSRVIVRDEVIDRAHVQSLQRCADAYVSLHRSEGFGLGLAECMSKGKPVIATAWSGNLEFMDESNSCLVDYTLVSVEEGEYLHHVGQRWAEPRLESAVEHMRRLATDPQHAASIGRKAALDVRASLSSAVVAERLIERFAAILADESVRASHSTRRSPQSRGKAEGIP